MGMFGLDFAHESAYTNNLGFNYTAEDDTMMESMEAIPCADDFDYAFARIELESATNFHNLMMAITVNEMNVFMATNEEVIYEESSFSKIIDSVKEAIDKAWQKAKGIFQKVMDTISGWISADKKFVEKYGKAVREFNGKVKLKNGYEFTHIDSSDFETRAIVAFNQVANVKGLFDHDGSGSKKGELDYSTDIEEFASKMRAKCIPGYGGEKLSMVDFGKEIDKYFRNNKEKSDTVYFTKDKAEDLLKEISEAKISKKAARASYDAVKKYFAMLKKEAQYVQSAATAANKEMLTKEHKNDRKTAEKGVGRFVAMCNKAIIIGHTMMSGHIRNINAAHHQAKKVVLKMVRGEDEDGDDKKPEAQNASAWIVPMI